MPKRWNSISRINTIIACKVAYKATRVNRDCEDQDNHNLKAAAWDTMVNYYNDDSNEDLNELLLAGIDALIGASNPNDCPYNFDVLKSGELEQVIMYIIAQYQIAQNEKTQKQVPMATFHHIVMEKMVNLLQCSAEQGGQQ